MTKNNVSVNKIFSGIGPVKPIDNIDRTKDDLIHRNDYKNNNQKDEKEPSKFQKMVEEEQKKLANSLTVEEFDEILKENIPYRHEIIKNYQLAKEGNKEAWENVKAMLYNEPIPASFYQRFWLPKINDVEEQLFSSSGDKFLRRNNMRKITSAMDDETMWEAFEDIKDTLFETLSRMSWLSTKGSRLENLCEDLTAQIIAFDMDYDAQDILTEYYS